MIVSVLGLLAVVGLGLALICHKRRDEILAVLIGVTAGFANFQIARVHVFTLVVFVWAIFKFSRHVNRTIGLFAGLAACTVLIASTAVFGDLIVSSTLALQLVALTICAGAIALWSSAGDRRLMVYGLLGTTTVSSVWALAQVTQIIPSQVIHLDISAIGRPSGLTPEPDWLGMFSAVGIFLAFTLPMPKWLRFVVMGLNTVAWFLAFARAAWVAVIVVVVVLALITVFDRRRTLRSALSHGRGHALAACVVAFALPTLLISSVRQDLLVRLSHTFVSSFTAQDGDQGGEARVQQVSSLLYLADHSPFYGHGLSSAGRVGVSGLIYYTGPSPNSVASNWVLGLWVDAGYLALPFIACIAVLLAFTITTLPGQMLAVVCVCSFFSNATYFPVFWLAIGLALCSVASKRRERTPDRPDSRNEYEPSLDRRYVAS